MSIAVTDKSAGVRHVTGCVDIRHLDALRTALNEAPEATWDFRDAEDFDSAAALTVWEFWNGTIPEGTLFTRRQQLLFDRLARTPPEHLAQPLTPKPEKATFPLQSLLQTQLGLATTLGTFALDLLYLVRHPQSFPLRDMSAACYRFGVTALPITAVVGFLIGIVLSYLSSLSLRDFGAESFLPMVLGIGILRELGPLLTAIVLAGRSGSSITAGLAAMRLTQELDALAALGVSRSRRLVMPRVIAMMLVTPALTLLTNAAALIGGMISGIVELDLAADAFAYGLQKDVPLIHFQLGLFKSAVFGTAIGLIACYYGLHARANTQSLATHTTNSVVLSISSIIVLDALFAVLFKDWV